MSNYNSRSTGASKPIERPWRYFGRWFFVLIFLLTAFLPGPLHFSPLQTVQVAKAVSTSVVISQLQVAGATASDEFVELHNIGPSPVDLNGYRLVYRSAAGVTDVSLTSWSTSTIIPPGGFYLAGGSGYGGAVSPNITFSNGLAGPGGGVAVRNGPLDTGVVIDSVGYGTATNAFVEGTVTPAPAASSARIRTANSCQDTDNNSSDFVTQTPSTPRNLSSQAVTCGGNAPVVPACGPTLTTLQGTAATRQVTASDFDGTVTQASVSNFTPLPAPGSITLGSIVPPASAGGTLTATLTVDNAVPVGSYAVTLTFTNTDAPTPQTANCNITVNVLATPTTTPIYTIQGAARQSPSVGQTLATQGVVIGVKSSGFFIQSPNGGDGDLTTSDGIFVFTSTAPAVTLGHSVLVSGTVQEFISASRPTDAPLTELGSVTTVVDLGVGPIITPTVIVADPARLVGGNPYLRKPPTEVIFDPANPGYNPAVNGLDFYESLEGMLVQVDNALVVGPTTSFGEIVIVPDNGVGTTGLTARKAIAISASTTITDFNPERLYIDDDEIGAGTNPKLMVGDKINATLRGPLDYGFSNYRVQITSPLTQYDTSGEPAQESITALSDPNQLRVGTYNIQNFIQNPASALDLARAMTVANQIKNNLASPDLLVLEEVQDDTGATAGTTVTADVNLGRLRDNIIAIGGPTYSFKYISPVADQDGGQPGGNIRQVFFYRTDRGLTFDAGTPGDATTSVTYTTPTGLSLNPGRIDPTNAAFSSSRKPLAGQFTFNGQRLVIIGNHFNSRIGDTPLYGATQPQTLTTQAQRDQQAQIVRDFVSGIVTADPTVKVIVAGDLNEFQFGSPIKILKDGNGTLTGNQVLTDIIDNPALNTERYTSAFEGNSEVIDHILYSASLAPRLINGDIVHINTDYLATDPRRASDHEPVVAVFNFGTLSCDPYVVSVSTDNGAGTACGTLSFALTQAITDTQPITISFSVPAITVTGPLPTITNTNGFGITLSGACTPSGNLGVPGVQISGSGVSVGLTLTNSIVITGVSVVSFTNTAISITGSNNRISCSYLGTANGTGSDAAPNSAGLRVATGAKNNSLGLANTPNAGNLIVGKGVSAIIVPSGAQLKFYPGNRVRQV